MKRRIAIAFLATILLLVGGSLAVLRTRWAGDRICALVEAKVSAAAGLPLSLTSCRIDPVRLEVSAERVRLGPPGAPVFTAESVSARLAPVQALGGRIHLEELTAVAPRLALALPPPAPGGGRTACPPPLLSRFEVHRLRVERGSLDLALPGGGRIAVDRFDVRLAPAARPSLRSLTSSSRRSRVAVDSGPVRIDAGARHLVLERVNADGDLALDLSRLELRGADLEGEGIKLGARGEVRNLCAPALALELTASAPLPAAFALVGWRGVRAEGSAAVQLWVTGAPAAPEVSGEVKLTGARIGPYAPGDARAKFRLAGGTLAVDRLEVPFQTGGSVLARGTLSLGREVGLAAEVETRQMEFGELLARLGLQGSWVTMRLTTKARLSGTAWPLALSGEAGIDVQDFKVLSRAWTGYRPGEPTVLDFRRGRIDAGVRVGPEAVRVDQARIQVGEETLVADAELTFARGFSVAMQGGVDLGELRHLAAVPWAGRLALAGALRAPIYSEPRLEAQVRARGLRFLQVDLGDLSAAFRYQSEVLHLEEGKGTKGETRYGAELALDLGRAPARLLSSRLLAQGRLRDLFEAVTPWLPAARRAAEVLEGPVSLEASAEGPVAALDASFDARLGAGALGGRAFDSGRAKGRIEGGRRAVFERAELHRGPGAARASGAVEFDPAMSWDWNVSFGGVQLGHLDLPGGGWTGSASGTATLAGSLAEPSIRFAANGDGVALRDVPIGTVQVGGNLLGEKLSLTGTAEGLRFAGTARLSGDMPFQASAEIDLDDVTRLIPGGAPAGLRARVAGQAVGEGALADLSATRARVRISRFHGGYGDFKVDNKDPMVISLDRGRVEIESFTLVGANTEFALSGARAASGALDLNAGGSLDLRLLGGLVPAVSAPRGQLALEAHVSGTGPQPILVGAGRLRDAGFQLPDLPVVFARMNGDLAFSQNRVLFDDLAATMNGGKANLRGEVELARFVPSRLRVEAALDTVPMSIPAYIPSWVSGDLTAFGTPEAMTLAGKLHVLRATYTEKVDIEKGLLEFRRRRAAARPYDKSAEWLRLDVLLLLDGDARVDNDLVKGGVRGEVTVTGSLASLGLVGALAMTPGSRATFRGNEFALSHAVVDFTDRHRIHASFDVHGDAQVRDYQIFMHSFGTLENPQLQLTSAPPLSQQDILTLLSLGVTTRDAAASAGMGGMATAAAAQALFSVSGLDEQVRRFLPRQGIFGDLSMRMTSAYSEGTGQVEPRAEFEGKVLKDRLRLRYQTPLSGARGQRAQAELRVGEHSSLQYQWDNESDIATGGDHGVDLKLRWEWND